MYCPNCGKQLPDNTRFCHYCGAEQAAPAPAQPARPDYYAAPQPKKKSKAGPIIAIAAVVAALLLGVFVVAPAMQGSHGEGAGLNNAARSPQDSSSVDNTPADARETLGFTPAQFMERMGDYLPWDYISIAGEIDGGRYAVIDKDTGNEVARFVFYISGGGEAASLEEAALTAVQFAYQTEYWSKMPAMATASMATTIEQCDPSLGPTGAEEIAELLRDGLLPYVGEGAATEYAHYIKNDVAYDLYHYVVHSDGFQDVDEFSLEIMLKTEAERLGIGDVPGSVDTAGSGGYADRETNGEYYQALAAFGYQMPNSFETMAEGLSDPTLEFFIRDNGDGTVECHDYAAEGDTLVKYYETILLDLTGIPAEQKEQIIGSLTAGLPELNALACVTARYEESTDGTLGLLTVECTGLDRQENRSVLHDLGIFGVDGPYSLYAVKQAELGAGFISLFK